MKKHNNNGVIYIYASPMDGPSNHHQTPHGANVQSPKRHLLHRCGDGVPKSPGSSDRTWEGWEGEGEGGCFELIKEKKGNYIYVHYIYIYIWM